MPITAVTGTVGKTTVASLLDQLAREAGCRTVTWLDSGVTIDGRRQVGELAPWGRGLQLVLQRQLDLAIQELPATTVQAVGLPRHSYRAAVITNLANNDATYEGSAAVGGQRVANRALAMAVHPEGQLVLNADDHAVADLASESAGEVILWAMRRQSPPLDRHLRRGGRGLYLIDDQLLWETAGQRQSLGRPADSPATLAGQATFQVQNLLAALAVALALDLPPELLSAALPRLDASPGLVERSFTLKNGIFCRALVASASCLPALRALVRMMSRLANGSERIIGSAVWPEGLGEAEERETARILGRLYGLIYFYGPRAEHAAALVTARRPDDRPPTFCVPVASEREALRRLTRVVAAGDRLLLLAESVPATVSLLDARRTTT